MRLGIFGGTFDPVHYGHLLLAESCREECQLDRVWFVPTGAAPHKQGHAAAEAEHRVEMLRLAIAGHPQFDVCTLEIDRGGLSYTIDTLESIRTAQSDDELYLLVGADMWHDLPHWRRPEQIVRLATVVAVRRPGSPPLDAGSLAPGMPEPRTVTMPEIGLSSRILRQRVAAGKSIRYWTPRGVELYIQTHGLYRG